MCDKCEAVYKAFSAPKKEQWRSFNEFYDTINLSLEYIGKDIIEYYAGDGPLETINDYFDTSMETSLIMFYLRCKSCNQYYQAGLYAKGEPLLKVLATAPDEKIIQRLPGRAGVYFENRPGE